MFRALIAQAATAAVVVSACAAPAPAGSPTSANAPVTTATLVPSAPATSAPATSAPATSGTPLATATAPGAVLDPATVNPCSFVSAARVGEVLGEAVAEGVLKESGGAAQCFFDVPGWPGVTIIPQDPGVSITIYREPKTVAAYDPSAYGDQQVVAEVDGLGDGAWWRHHVELPNVHIDTDTAVLDVFAEPIQFAVAFTQIPNPVGVDKTVWLADATELANDVLGALGR